MPFTEIKSRENTSNSTLHSRKLYFKIQIVLSGVDIPFGIKRSFNYLIPAYPVSTIHGINVGSMLAHRLRRWANIDPTLVHSIVFTE